MVLWERVACAADLVLTEAQLNVGVEPSQVLVILDGKPLSL